jgi:hypothetical protein
MQKRLITEVRDGLYEEYFNIIDPLTAEVLDDFEIWDEINCYDMDGIENLVYDVGFIAGLETVLNYLQTESREETWKNLNKKQEN